MAGNGPPGNGPPVSPGCTSRSTESSTRCRGTQARPRVRRPSARDGLYPCRSDRFPLSPSGKSLSGARALKDAPSFGARHSVAPDAPSAMPRRRVGREDRAWPADEADGNPVSSNRASRALLGNRRPAGFLIHSPAAEQAGLACLQANAAHVVHVRAAFLSPTLTPNWLNAAKTVATQHCRSMSTACVVRGPSRTCAPAWLGCARVRALVLTDVGRARACGLSHLVFHHVRKRRCRPHVARPGAARTVHGERALTFRRAACQGRRVAQRALEVRQRPT